MKIRFLVNKVSNRQTDRQTDRQAGRQAGRQTPGVDKKGGPCPKLSLGGMLNSLKKAFESANNIIIIIIFLPQRL